MASTRRASPQAARPDPEGVSVAWTRTTARSPGAIPADGRLSFIPTKRSKLLVVLDHLAGLRAGAALR